MAPAGLNVVIVSPHPVVPELVGLLLGQVSERTADLKVRFRAEKINGFQNLFEYPRRRALGAYDYAEIHGAHLLRLPGGSKYSFRGHKRVSFNLGIEMGRLGAEGAVLGTVPGLGTYDRTQKHPVALVLEGDFSRKRYEFREALCGKFRKREGVFEVYVFFFFQKLFGNYVKNVYFSYLGVLSLGKSRLQKRAGLSNEAACDPGAAQSVKTSARASASSSTERTILPPLFRMKYST